MQAGFGLHKMQLANEDEQQSANAVDHEICLKSSTKSATVAEREMRGSQAVHELAVKNTT